MSGPKKIVKKKRTLVRRPQDDTANRAPKHKINDDTLALSVSTGGEANSQIKVLKDKENEMRSTIVAGMLERKIKKTSSGGYTATLSQKSGGEYLNSDALKKRLGAALWKEVTTTVLDREKLNAMIALGKIDAAVVAQCTEKGEPGNPYITFSKD